MNAQTFILPPEYRDSSIGRITAAAKDFAPGERVRVTLELQDGPRTMEQNSGVWKLYEQIALHYGDRTKRDVTRECKLHHGVPILRRDDAEYRAIYDSVIKPLPYEKKLEAMDFWPVTRQMGKHQLSEYLDEVQRQYGVYLRQEAA